MIQITVTKIESAGSFLCCPKNDKGDEEYGDFLASLNNYFSKYSYSSSGELIVPAVGEIYACKTSIGESDELWYRCMVNKLYNSQGLITGVLLVDVGEQVYVTKARMRKLPDHYKSFPHQSMKCILNDLVPVSLQPNTDLFMSLKKTNRWDSSATTFVEDLLRGAETFIQIHSQSHEGERHVTLFAEKSGITHNVNELLITKKFCTLKQTEKSTLMPDIPSKANSEVVNSIDTSVARSPQKLRAPEVAAITPAEILKKSEERRRQKEQKIKEISRYISKDCQRFLDLVNGDSTTPLVDKPQSEKTDIPTSSGTSDLSDIESTPVLKNASYKQAQRYSSSTTDQLGGTNYEFLANFQKPDKKESPKISKIDQFMNTETKTFDFVDNSNDFKVSLNNSSTHLAVASGILNVLSIGGASSSKKKANKEVDQLDVLVHGKDKRPPMETLEKLSLPSPVVSALKAMGFNNPTQFQMHMWPAILAQKSVVGIADTNNSDAARALAYLLPLLRNLILDDITYPELGRANGPYVIICVPEWQEAQLVYDICEKLLEYYKKTLRVDVRYGGMDNECDRNIRMLNGCEILVTTVTSLNNCIEAGYTNLNRLCHLVFENARRLFDEYTDGVKTLMATYENVLKNNPSLTVNQIIAVGMKWAACIKSFMKQCMPSDQLAVISNPVEIAVFAKVPIVVELCNASDRLECLLGFLETDACNENSVVFTSSAKSADELQQHLHRYSIAANVITEFTPPTEVKDVKLAWNSAAKSKGMNVLVLSDRAALNVKIRNATVVVHYDFPHKKEFGNRLLCLFQNIQENETKEKPKPLLSQIFVTEKDNSMRYTTGLEKLLRRSGQRVPEQLKSMAESARELKEEEKQYQELCPRLKLFGYCRFIDDCNERHTIFPDKDLLGICPNTGFVKVKILDVVSASCYYGRIIEHNLPFEGRPYDTTVFLTLTMDMSLHYSVADNRKRCTTAGKYDICVFKSDEYDYQRVRIEKIVEKDFERPKKIEVFGIDNGFTKVVEFGELLVCDEKFKNVPCQAVEVIACCVQPVEHGTSWTYEASYAMERKVKGKILEGRVKLSLQNTIWIDPLAEKELLEGMQTMTYTLDVGRDLINMGFAELNNSHLDNLRKLLYDVQGISMEVKTENKGLPLHMVGHDEEYLSEDTFEEVYVSSVTHPGLFFVHRAEQRERLDKLDDKIDATMKVKRMDPELLSITLPNGYICVAKYSGDDKWYRGKILGVNEKTGEYDIFFVDHGDREWIGKSKVVPGWADIMSLPFQAIQCTFAHITPKGKAEWSLEDGDKLWDMTCDKLLQIQPMRVGPSAYLSDRISYDVELYDTTGNINVNISHELVYAGVADGSLECLQAIFPRSDTTKKRKDKKYQHESDQICDICVEIYLCKEEAGKLQLAKEVTKILLNVKSNFEYLEDNGCIMSICKLMALNQDECSNEELVNSLQYPLRKSQRCCETFHDNNGIQILLNILMQCQSAGLKNTCLKVLKLLTRDEWYQGAILDYDVIPRFVKMIENSRDVQGTCLLVDLIGLLCEENSTGNGYFRQQNGLETLCKLITPYPVDFNLLDSCAKTFLILLRDPRSRDRIRECGGLQDIASVIGKQLNDATLMSYLQVIAQCTVGNEMNRESFHRIKVHMELKKISQLPIRYSPKVKELLKELINLITPGPLTDFQQIDSQVIDPRFYEEKKEISIPDEKPQKGAPMTYWSQTGKHVILSIRLRGVEAEETSIESSRVHFRTYLNKVEYELDLVPLYSEINDKDFVIDVKGGEVLIKVKKLRPIEWPRLLQLEQKLPYVRYDFDRWQEDIPAYGEDEDYGNKEYVPFLPGLPPPPKSNYDPKNARPAPLYDFSDDTDSSCDESDDDDDDDDRFYQDDRGNDFFKL